MGKLYIRQITNWRRRTYEILREHCPEKADWEYIKLWEADIPRRYGDKVRHLHTFVDDIGYRLTRRN